MTTVRSDVTAVTHEPLELGEGPLWWSDHLYLVDILSGRLLRVEDFSEPGSARLAVVAEVGVPLGAAVPIAGAPDRWLAAAGTGLAVLQPPDRLDWIARPEDDAAVPTRMNDAGADPAGRVWAGSMAWDARPQAGSLYRLDGRGVTRVLDGITIPNGLAFGAGGDFMYLADSAPGVIDRLALDPATGDFGARVRFVEFEEGYSPDGMVVDTAGALWVAVWGGGQVRRYLPDGRLDTVVEVPAAQPSSVCLGGPDRTRLFITTATEDMDSPSPADGLVYSATVDVPGLPAWTARFPPSVS